MMSETWRDGKLVSRLNETNKRVETMAADGVTVASWVDMTPEQSLAADAYLAEVAARTERENLRTAVRAIITEIKAERDKLEARFVVDGAVVSNTTISNNPAPFVKDNYTALKRTMAAVIDLAKLVKDFD